MFASKIPDPVTPSMLVDLGIALFGDGKRRAPVYQTALAELFGVSTRHLRRMLLGETPISPIRIRQFWRIHDALARAAERE